MEPHDWNTSNRLRNDMASSGETSGTVVAVTFLDLGVTYVHPGYDLESGDLPQNWATGAGQLYDGSLE